MTTSISFADWVDWIAIELTFTELYESATPESRRELQATVRRLAEGIDEATAAAFAARVPNLEQALSRFTVQEQTRFPSRLSVAVTELARHYANTMEQT